MWAVIMINVGLAQAHPNYCTCAIISTDHTRYVVEESKKLLKEDPRYKPFLDDDHVRGLG